jgi:purine nucleosidase
VRVHLDTDLGSDTDDACALAMLLGWPDVEIVGITTTIDPGGRRAGYVAECLRLAGHEGIPVAAGAEVSLTTLQCPGEIPDDARFWPRPVSPRPARAGTALDLLDANIGLGATVVAVGPYTNLALLEVARPGRLDEVPVVLMGGSVHPPPPGFPAWGPEHDWNVQCDNHAADIVATTPRLTLVPLEVTVRTHLRAADLPRLRASGPLGELLARQAAAHAEDHRNVDLGRAHAGLPDDLLNFHHDPLACAVAVGWPGVSIEELRIQPVLDGRFFRFQPDEHGRLTRVVTNVDGAAFSETWLTAVEAAQRQG